jgi:hypothetical protein
MTDPITPDPTTVCEALLLTKKQRYLDKHILPSEREIIDRLIARRLELPDAYRELHDKLAQHPDALDTMLGTLLNTAAFWNPQRIAEIRSQRTQLRDINGKIGSLAAELSELLEERTQLHETSGFLSETHGHIGRVIEGAARDNPMFDDYLAMPLRQLRGQFDSKYWPTIEACIAELARDAYGASPEASDPLTAAATAGLRGSLTDYFEALAAGIEENDTNSCGPIPAGLVLSDNTLASLVNCALDLDPDTMVDAAYVKGLRQRRRTRSKKRQPSRRS